MDKFKAVLQGLEREDHLDSVRSQLTFDMPDNDPPPVVLAGDNNHISRTADRPAVLVSTGPQPLSCPVGQKPQPHTSLVVSLPTEAHGTDDDLTASYLPNYLAELSNSHPDCHGGLT
jgi:hypothetical protein